MSKLIIFSAPSGSGKTTIVKQILKKINNLEFSISACSRDKREGEIDGKDYYFLGVEGFKKQKNAGEFLEWEEVYKDQYYGTLKSEVQRIWDKGNNVIFDVDVIGGLNIKKQFEDQALALFIMPPSIEELENRLAGRGTDTAESIAKRIAKAEEEIIYSKDFDKIVINNKLEMAVEEAYEIISDFIDK